MYLTIYYILGTALIIFSLLAAFSEKPGRSQYSFVMLIFVSCGLLVLLNSALIAIVILLITSASVLLFMIFRMSDQKESNSNTGKPIAASYILIIITGLFAALLTSLLSSTRFPVFEIDFDSVYFALIFSAYLPLLLLAAVIISASLPFVITSLKKGENR